MGIGLTEEHEELAAYVRGFTERYVPREAVRAAVAAGTDRAERPEFWPALAEDLLGLHLPERYGGRGLSLLHLAVAVEEPPGEDSPLLQAAAEVFNSWRGALATSLIEHGADEAHAGRLATMVIASVEGALAMCRARGDLQPLEDVGAELEAMLEAAIA